MRPILALALLTAVAVPGLAGQAAPARAADAIAVPATDTVTPAPAGAAATGAHAFSFTSIDGQPMPLSAYAGHPMLIVNTASFCGYTYQYEGLERLWHRYRDQGLVVVGIPSGDFANQEYGSNGEIKDFCDTRFDIDFPMTEKVHVKGSASDPLFVWLRRQLGDGPGPLWNFHKYLVDANGNAVASFPSAIDPDNPAIIEAIEKLLPPARASRAAG